MKWFKFYGQDFLTDTKMKLLTLEEKMCWITLMCLANSEDKNGRILFVNGEEVMKQSGIEEETPMWFDTRGFLDKFKELEMITTVTKVTGGVTQSNKALRYDVLLTNFNKRQTENLSNSERQKKHREKLKQAINTSNNSNTFQSNDSNARIEENRIDKNRIEYNTNKELLKNKFNTTKQIMRNK